MVDVIILAGGYATRLRPLTFTKPKPLLPILNKAVIDWILESVTRVKPSDVFLSVRYMSDLIEKHVNHKWASLKGIVNVIREDKPLGDGGPVSYIASMHELDDVIVVFNGDIFTKIDLEDAINEHVSKGALATICLTQVNDVSQYGVVTLGKDNLVTGFVEKPEPGNAPSNLINAGVYIFSKDALKYFPKPGTFGKLAIDILPRMIKDHKVYGYTLKGYWYDIGTITSYLDANFRALDEYCRDCPVPNNDALIKPPAFIGENVTIEPGAEVGPYVVVLNNSRIGAHSRVKYSVVMDNTTIENGAYIDLAVLGSDVFVGKWARIEKGVVVGDGSYIGDHVLINRDSIIGPFREVNQSIYEVGKILL
ncbi:sugar phosphate nucleotidyltransferase [Caldivirga sp.]|uniref:sugar phosphate nucleotidyltransferase n=1 Tax=Caldivirga sp. TaxID=2080243 RepID=UPI003D09AEA3